RCDPPRHRRCRGSACPERPPGVGARAPTHPRRRWRDRARRCPGAGPDDAPTTRRRRRRRRTRQRSADPASVRIPHGSARGTPGPPRRSEASRGRGAPEDLPLRAWSEATPRVGVKRSFRGSGHAIRAASTRGAYSTAMKRLAALAIVGGVVLGARHAAPTGDVQAGLYFPRAGPNGGIVMETLLEGPLVVRNACVEIGDPGDYT